MFSVGSAPKMYNEDLTQLKLELGRVLEMAVQGDWLKKGKKGIRLCQEDYMCELKWQRDCIKPVSRIGLVKTENPSARVTVNWNVCRITIALYYL
jgi:hypothetical protein